MLPSNTVLTEPKGQQEKKGLGIHVCWLSRGAKNQTCFGKHTNIKQKANTMIGRLHGFLAALDSAKAWCCFCYTCPAFVSRVHFDGFLWHIPTLADVEVLAPQRLLVYLLITQLLFHSLLNKRPIPLMMCCPDIAAHGHGSHDCVAESLRPVQLRQFK